MDHSWGTIISCYKLSKAIALGTAIEWNGISRLAQPWVCSLPSVLGKINSFLYHSEENIKPIWPSYPKERNECLEVFKTMLTFQSSLIYDAPWGNLNISTNPILIPGIDHMILQGWLNNMYYSYLHILLHAHFILDQLSVVFTGPSLFLDSYSSNTMGSGNTCLCMKSLMHMPSILTIVCSSF